MRLVIFDLDGTLAKDNVSFAFSKFLYKKGRLSPFKMFSLIFISLLFRFGLVSVERVHKIAFDYIMRGKRVEDIASQIALFLQNCPFRPYLIELLRKAQSDNNAVWLLSSSPDCLVKQIAASLGIDTTLATSYLVEDGRYIDIDQIVTGETKYTFLQNANIKKENITAYSDSIQDLKLLESVGCPIAVCPDPALKKVAFTRNWQILEETVVDFTEKP